jgi:hypothetical protein
MPRILSFYAGPIKRLTAIPVPALAALATHRQPALVFPKDLNVGFHAT